MKQIEYIGIFLTEDDDDLVILTFLYCYNCCKETVHCQLKNGDEYVCIVCGKHTAGVPEN
jgi:hypothetical protein